jgi:hypothetical protein
VPSRKSLSGKDTKLLGLKVLRSVLVYLSFFEFDFEDAVDEEA